MSQYCLYRFYDEAGVLLYVGVTMNPVARWRQHRQRKPWWVEVANIAIERHPNRLAALRAERQAIQAEQPKWNVVYNGLVATNPLVAKPHLAWVDVFGPQERTVLMAYRSEDGTLYAWCIHCAKWHTHGGCNGQCTALRRQGRLAGRHRCECPKGAGDGHRVAHCGDLKSPYRMNGGYVLKEVGLFTPQIQEAYQ